MQDVLNIGVRLIERTPEIEQEINQSNLGFKVNQERGVLIVAVAPNSLEKNYLKLTNLYQLINIIGSPSPQVTRRFYRKTYIFGDENTAS
ncbi:2-alkenal reductase [Kalymmatonema gypsitolerans NIES-4073]|nr:2-alkenal reductase [Scytonema sp. NIES-4073]